MQIRFSANIPSEATLVVFPVEKGGLDRLKIEDGDHHALLTGAAEASRFEGSAGSIVEVFAKQGTGMARMALLGLGSGSESDFEKAGGALVVKYLASGVNDAAVDFGALAAAPSAKAVARFAGAAAQRSWRHDVYRTRMPERSKPTLQSLTVVGAPEGTDSMWQHVDAVTQGMALTRSLVAEPANILYPESFVERARELEALGIKLTVLDEPTMRDLGMGALLGVSQGSTREGRLLAMHWQGRDGDGTDLALVGKGVTFDTGGISLKPGPGMEDMKWDMGGAGTVTGTMKALALRKAKANVVGICGLVENMPDGNAQRPGDIVTSMSGQTIEVLNTDAEGRLVLADALTWVQREFKPGTIVDLATLTGAMLIALGHEHAGLFSNDDSLADQLLAAGRTTGDLLWRMPLSDAYNKLLDSPIADMKNIGPRYAGSITAAQFLQRFVEDGVRWAHLDVAGMVWSEKPGPNYDKGATGYGVRMLDRFVADNFEG